jgi:hypothetical protein
MKLEMKRCRDAGSGTTGKGAPESQTIYECRTSPITSEAHEPWKTSNNQHRTSIDGDGGTKHLTPALSPLPLQGNAEREKRSQRFGEVMPWAVHGPDASNVGGRNSPIAENGDLRLEPINQKGP